MSVPHPLLEKAGRSLQAAERLLREGDSDFAASRTYYAYFYVARALLLTLGLDFSRHGQIVSQFLVAASTYLEELPEIKEELDG